MDSVAQNSAGPWNLPLQPAHRLLLACAAPVDSPRHRQIAGLCETEMDWPLLIETARAQRVGALCYAALRELPRSAVPGEAMASFRADALALAGRNLQLAAKLTEIAEAAGGAGIALVPYKGAVLAEMAYGNLGLREFADLDFILTQRDLGAAWKLLEGLGYVARNPALAQAGAPIPGEYVFRLEKSGVQVELHTELTLRHFPSPPDLGSLLAAREPVTLVGRSVLTFSREDTLTLLAVHGAKDFWEALLWVCDVAWLVAAPDFDWQAALQRADGMRCRRMVNVALLLASELLEAGIPAAAMAAAQADRVARTQARWLTARIFASRSISPFVQLRYRIRMIEGLMPGIRYAARLATMPAADDWNAVPLPNRFGFAYALLRPLRLLRK